MKQFEFTREFTRDGQVVSEADGRYVLSTECERRVAHARQDTLAGVEQDIARAVTEIAANLNPVVPALTSVAGGLRREAVELALGAAEVIAGAALDQNMIERATQAVEQVVAGLRTAPDLIVTVPEEMIDQIGYRLEDMVRKGRNFTFRIEPRSGDAPGEWRIRWDGGETAFDRQRAIEIVRDAVENHMSMPPDVQGDLFGKCS